MSSLTLLFLRVILHGTDQEALAAIERWGDLLCAVDTMVGGQQAKEALSSYLLATTDLTAQAIDATLARILRNPIEETAMSTADRLLAQGRTEGRTEGRAELLLRQLQSRFGDVPLAVTARVRNAATTDLDRWAIAVLDAGSLAEVFAND